MDAEGTLGYEYEKVTDTGIVLRERRAGYSTHGHDLDNATSAIIGCALEVHKTLAPRFRETVYQTQTRRSQNGPTKGAKSKRVT